MRNDVQDKQFVALELTKIAYPPTSESADLEEICGAYCYFLREVMGITEEVDTITSLRNEVERLQKENERLKADNLDPLAKFCGTITKVLDDCKGDMEPYVYKAIYDLVNIPKV